MVASYNGWKASKSPAVIDVDPGFTAAARRFPGGVKRGPVSVVLRYVIEQFDKRVEEVDLYDPGDEWGYVYKQSANSQNLVSCHSSGTAVDINATRHPNGTPASKTFTAEQIAAIRAILAEVDGVVRWLGDARKPDPMHFEIAGTEQEVARVAGRLLSTVPPAPAPAPPEDDTVQLIYVRRKDQAQVHLGSVRTAPRPVKLFTDAEWHAALTGDTIVPLAATTPSTEEIADGKGTKRRVLVVADGSLYGL